MATQIHNFTAGPAVLPQEVLDGAAAATLDFAGSGISLLSISHRDDRFEQVLCELNRSVRQLLHVPGNYSVLWMQGGASMQFAAVVINIIARQSIILPENTSSIFSCEYVVTGTWSQKAAEEASKLGAPVRIITSSKINGYTATQPPETWDFTPVGTPVLYRYYCANETVHGVEIDIVASDSVILVADMSSNIMSKPIDVSKHGIIFAGVQKNMGPAGVTMVIVRNDLLTPLSITNNFMAVPTMLDYHILHSSNSLYNTPPVFSIYVTKLMLDWVHQQGGIPAMERLNEEKANAVYTFIDQSGFYKAPVALNSRSRMNIVFRIYRNDKFLSIWQEGEVQFIKDAELNGFIGLQGHRSVGGLRVSLYNAVTMSNVQALLQFMKSWQQSHPSV